MRKPKRINTFRSHRTDSGFSRKQAAEKIGISVSYLEKIENDVRIPGRRQLVNMAKVYNCKIDDLLETA